MGADKRLFIVANPTQYLNAVEYSCLNQDFEDHLAIMTFNPSSFKELDKLGADKPWTSINSLIFKREEVKSDKEFWGSSLKFLRSLYLKISPMELAVGNLVDGLIYPFVLDVKSKVEKITLLDDGIPTLNIAKHRIEGDFYRFYHLDSIRNVLKKSVYLKQFIPAHHAPKHLNFFTLFNLSLPKNDSLTPNHYQWVKEQVGPSNPLQGAWFVGSHMVDRGLVSEKHYLDSLRYVKAYAESKGEDFVYIHHRSESEDIKGKIQAFCKTVQFAKPLELALLEGPRPKYMFGHFSSALFNLSRIYEETEYCAFLFEDNQLKGTSSEPLDYLLTVQKVLREDPVINHQSLPTS